MARHGSSPWKGRLLRALPPGVDVRPPRHPLFVHQPFALRMLAVAAAWIGNSVAVAMKHYLQVTEDHFKQASKKATQNPTSKAHESSRNDSKTQMPSEALESLSSSDCERLRPIATSCNSSEIQSMGDTGLEHVSFYTGKSDNSLTSAAKSGAVAPRIVIGIRDWLDQCPAELTPAVRAAVVALVHVAEAEAPVTNSETLPGPARAGGLS